MKRIKLTQGKFAIVDDEDYAELSKYKWYTQKAKHTYYAARTVYLGGGRKHQRSKRVFMHNQIMPPQEGMMLDHANHKGWDNRKHNLRICTHTQNLQYSISRRGTSKYKGVWKHKNGKWRARICCQRKQIHLGYFNAERAAACAYDAKAIKLFGAFALTNF